MNVVRENVKYYISRVVNYTPVKNLIANTVTMRPVTTISYEESATGTLYEIGGKEYVMHDGRWFECKRVCGVGERFIDLDDYRRLV